MIENYFENMDKLEKYYWYGFIFADGYNCYDEDKINYKFAIELQEKDIDILEKLAKEIEFTYKIQTTTKKVKNGFNFYKRIQIGRKEFSKHLNNLGINKSKSSNPTLIKMNDIEFLYFIRGLSDGDGCFCIDKRNIFTWNLVIHNDLVLYIKSQIERLTGINVCVQKHWRTAYMSTISINGNKNVYSFARWLYKSNDDLHLERKYKKYLLMKEYFSIKQAKNTTSKYRGVWFNKKINQYIAEIKVNNKKIYLGRSKLENDAAKIYNEGALKYKGIKAILNIIN